MFVRRIIRPRTFVQHPWASWIISPRTFVQHPWASWIIRPRTFVQHPWASFAFRGSNQGNDTRLFCRDANQRPCSLVPHTSINRRNPGNTPKCNIPRTRQIISTANASTSSANDCIVKSPLKDIEIEESPFLPHFVMEKWGEFENKHVMINGETGETMTYAELKDKIVRVGSALYKMGFRRGDVVTLMSHNCPEFCVFYLGAMSIGMTVSPVNSMYTPNELTHAVNECESVAVAVCQASSNIARESLKNCSTVKKTICFGQAEGFQPLSSLLEDDGKAFPENLDFDAKNDVIALPYSSGTTGLPKGVMLTNYCVAANVKQLGTPELINPLQDDIYIGVLPFFHASLQFMLVGLRAGVTSVVMPNFDPVAYLQNIQKYKATVLHTAPPMMLFLANHPLVEKHDLSSVQTGIVAAAPMPPTVIPKVQEKFRQDTCLLQGYGMTEASPGITCNPRSRSKPDTVGIPIHNTYIKIRDVESNELLGRNQEGEVCCLGPQIMKGYFKNEEATRTTIVDGWLHSGDIGYVDDDGYLVITDRLKELIKYKGFQVAPAELEDVLLTHPAVADAAVIGQPDNTAGELPRAYVVLKQDELISEDDISNFVKDKTASYKHLRGGVEFRAEIPRSPSGKILRRVLKDELLKEK